MSAPERHSPPPPYEPRSVGEESKVGFHATEGVFPPPPPQFGAPPSAPPQLSNANVPGSNVPVVTRVVCARTSIFGPFPVEMDCSYCHNHIVTHTSRVPGVLPWIIFSVCFVLGFFLVVPWCLCCLPFCIDSCLDVLHSCPSCKRLVGRFSRL